MKIMFLLPHCSTGGMPQYALKQIEEYRKGNDIVVVEINYYGADYVVQRNNIQKLVSFVSIQGAQSALRQIVEDYNPDIIYCQEVPETFLNKENLNFLYNENRKWFVVVTTHSSLTRINNFQYIPDRLVAVNKWQKNVFDGLIPDIEIWEYPIEDIKVTYKEKISARIKILGPDYHYELKQWETKGNLGTSGGLFYTPFGRDLPEEQPEKHILNVGLFTPGKNQGELFEVARKNPQNTYHFVGNQADNFKFYWEPLMKNRPKNCIVWGERADVDLFYKACDEFYFTSKFELNPLAVKEALSYGLPTKLYKLPSYLDDYDNNPLITYL